MGIPLPTAKTKATEISDAAQALNTAIRSGQAVGLVVALMVTDSEHTSFATGASPRVVVSISADPRTFEP